MKNFLRALSYAWPYRQRLIVSLVCALLAALLWGANFTAIYPLLKLLHSRQTLHHWVESSISSTQDEIANFNSQLDAVTAREAKLKEKEPSRTNDRHLREAAGEALRLENKLASARWRLYWYQVFKKYIYAFLPLDPFAALAWILGLLVAGIIVKCFFEFVQESLVGSVVNRSVCDLRNHFFRRAIHYDVARFKDKGTSGTELMARFTSDMEAVGTGLKLSFGKVIAEPLRVISCVVFACMISWQLTALFLTLVPVAVLIIHRVSRTMKKATRRVLEQMSSIYKILQESFQNIRAVKGFTREARERRRFLEATRDYHQRATRVVFIESLCDPIIETLGLTAVALALLAGSYLVLTGSTSLFGLQLTNQPMEPETLLQLYILLAATADPVRKLSSVFTRLQSAEAASQRIFECLDLEASISRNATGKRVERPEWLPPLRVVSDSSRPRLEVARPEVPKQVRVEFRDVCFSYEKDEPQLSGISFSAHAGETIALVGPNGCGKSTLVSLLPRFYDPDHGSILIDGQDLRKVNLRSLRQQVCIVTQDALLFDDTIFANIAYGCPGATMDQVEQAARMAMAHDFISRTPKGYQTRIGEIARVSGGEKQRLALARAILRDPSILILDEFTSQADAEKEVDIHRALREFKEGRTLFIITHRMNTLEIADRIVVLDRGRVVAVGIHAELIQSCVTYQRLVEAHSARLAA
jgi:ATP-binding cassette subfamily B protein/subfamily B ATP-binding cassette protein MsbA